MSSETAKEDASNFGVPEALALLKQAAKILDSNRLDVAAAHTQMAIDCCKEQLESHENS